MDIQQGKQGKEADRKKTYLREGRTSQASNSAMTTGSTVRAGGAALRACVT